MKIKYWSLPVFILLGMALSSCSDATSHTRSVYMLMDTSGTYAKELGKAQAIINYLLGTLNPGDSLAVARIDTGSFSEKDIVSKITFDKRPSVSNGQKRLFKERIDQFVSSVAASRHTDIVGGVLQAVEYLNETGAGKRHILIFSDLEQDLVEGYVRDFAIEMDDIHVVALNVTKLRSDNVDPRKYLERLDEWKTKVENGGGLFRVVNDLERLDSILME
jgi:hypothetical protein